MTDAIDPLRPSSWEGYIGQDALKQRLDIEITAALKANRPFPHTLFVGFPGAGKTTIANLVAMRMLDQFEQLDRPMPSGQLLSYLYEMGEGIVILDEVHRYPKSTQEDLLPLLEEGQLHLQSGYKVPLPRLTVLAATTEPQDVITPLKDRFTIKAEMAPYSDDELTLIVRGMAISAGLELDDETTVALARAAAGTPRIARRFVRAAGSLKLNGIDPTATRVLAHCQTDPDGLTRAHLEYLRTLNKLGGLKGVGLRQICAMTRTSESEVRGTERLLFERGLVVPTATGRALTPPGMARISERRQRRVA